MSPQLRVLHVCVGAGLHPLPQHPHLLLVNSLPCHGAPRGPLPAPPPRARPRSFAQTSPGVHQGFEYSRSHNPTRFAFERCVAALEGTGLTEADDTTAGAFAFASGLAAASTCFDLLDAGARVVCMDDV
jgi:cystathionine gamma-lyase